MQFGGQEDALSSSTDEIFALSVFLFLCFYT